MNDFFDIIKMSYFEVYDAIKDAMLNGSQEYLNHAFQIVVDAWGWEDACNILNDARDEVNAL